MGTQRSQLQSVREDTSVRDEPHNEAQALFKFPLTAISKEVIKCKYLYYRKHRAQSHTNVKKNKNFYL